MFFGIIIKYFHEKVNLHNVYASESDGNTEQKGSDEITPQRGVNYPSKLGISALQFIKIEYFDTQLARGILPLNPEQRRSEKRNRAAWKQTSLSE